MPLMLRTSPDTRPHPVVGLLAGASEPEVQSLALEAERGATPARRSLTAWAVWPVAGRAPPLDAMAHPANSWLLSGRRQSHHAVSGAFPTMKAA